MRKKTLPNKILIILYCIVIVILLFLILEILLRLTYALYKDYNTEMARYSKEMKFIKEDYIVHIPNKKGEYYGVNISINSNGWRDDKNYNLAKAANTRRVLILGDSITLGWGVQLNNTYPKILENKLNTNSNLTNYEVLNTGVGNSNTYMEKVVLEDSIKYRPDLIIVGFHLNDVENWEKRKNLFYLFNENTYSYMFFWSKLSNIFMNLGITKDYLKFYEDLYRNKKVLEQFEKNFEIISNISKKENIPLMIINIPDLRNIESYPFKNETNYIENISLSQGLYFLDLTNSFENYSSSELWVSKEDPHPNAIAHHIIANYLYDYILAEGFFDEKKIK